MYELDFKKLLKVPKKQTEICLNERHKKCSVRRVEPFMNLLSVQLE